MKCWMILLACVVLLGWVHAQETNYTSSTPAGAVVKRFLGIPAADSVDFIRWKLTLAENHFTLQCNYGIGKPNTNGFINGGESVSLEGELKKENATYQLYYQGRIIKLLKLNDNLLHFLDDSNALLVGNGGWSYTLNNNTPGNGDTFNLPAKQTSITDSIGYEGRTPCAIPSLLPPGKECYKLKWRISLYAAKNDAAPHYRLWGTLSYKEGGKQGTWNVVTTNNNRILYCLNNSDGKPFIYLLKADENILLFTDANGKPLVGNEDFSYTLNKISPTYIAAR